MSDRTYKHPETGNVCTKEEMLAEKTPCGQQRFREMGVAPAGVVVTDEMRQRIARQLPGTLADVLYPLWPVKAIEEVEAAENRRREAENRSTGKVTKLKTKFVPTAFVVHSAVRPYTAV